MVTKMHYNFWNHNWIKKDSFDTSLFFSWFITQRTLARHQTRTAALTMKILIKRESAIWNMVFWIQSMTVFPRLSSPETIATRGDFDYKKVSISNYIIINSPYSMGHMVLYIWYRWNPSEIRSVTDLQWVEVPSRAWPPSNTLPD